MIRSKQCPKCGSRNIAGPHKMQGDTYVRVDLPGLSTATLETFTCVDCGYTEMYADEIGLSNIRKVGRFTLNAPIEETRSCPYCGTLVRHGAHFCPECGNNI
ncbi:MAG: zinc ribbon domain-containing protein [Candidatus Odinarchaeota archaeon]